MQLLFWGNFIPLQGVECIIGAAEILHSYSDVQFKIIGEGQTFEEIKNIADKLKLHNVSFLGKVPLLSLPNIIQAADVCLGIFGKTNKAKRVIPNKVYEAIAMAKPVISADTPAMRELFINKQNILFCNSADPKDLADKILELRNDIALRDRIAYGGHELYKAQATPQKVVLPLLNILNKVI